MRSAVRIGRLGVVAATIAMAVIGPPLSAQRDPLASPHDTLAPAAEAHAPLPTSLSDSAFWAMHTRMSEDGGFFQSDNFTSNEANFPGVAADLIEDGHRGGAYLGVGPEQNFQYIVAIRPRIAFLFDIRRQAVMQHLMYKAIFELSHDRADFLAMLFSRPRPADVDTTATIAQLWDALLALPSDPVIGRTNLDRIETHLTQTHGFAVADSDMRLLEFVFDAFRTLGPGISYSGRRSPTNFESLSRGVDMAGVPRSFLATEENFRVIQEMHRKNLIVPVVADFGGPKGIRAVADYLKAHDATVTAFYVSNVEDYLFRPPNLWRAFYENVATLPIDEASVFIRPMGAGATCLPAGAQVARAVGTVGGGRMLTVQCRTFAPGGPPATSTTLAGPGAARIMIVTDSGRVLAIDSTGVPAGAIRGGRNVPIRSVALCPIAGFLRAYLAGDVNTRLDAVTCAVR